MITIILILAGFFIVQSVLDALHDVYGMKERNYLMKASSTQSPIKREEFKKMAGSYSKKWHALDAVIKTLSWVVLAVISVYLLGYKY